MDNSSSINKLELFCIIVNFGLGSKVLKIAKQNGIHGGTILLGKGTAKNHLLEFFDITDIRKEIVLLIADDKLVHNVLVELNKKFEFEKPNHGIAFTSSLSSFFGSRNCKCEMSKESRGTDMEMYNAIFVIVDKGLSESVLDAASKAGSRGGTVINARGSGIHETQTLFSMAIEPEKEIVLILSESNSTGKIVESVREHLKIDEPGKGIMFVMDVNKTYGLY